MIDDIGRVDRDSSPAFPNGAMLNEEGPWGSGEDKTSGGRKGDAGGPRNPWTQSPRRRPRGTKGEGQPSLEELIRRGRARFSGGLPAGGRPIWGYVLGALVVLWLVTTSIHRIDPSDRGVIMRFGRYAGTLKPGLGVTLPAPIDVVTPVNVDDQHDLDVPASGGPNLLLTRDQDLVNLAYTVRWQVHDPDLYLFNVAGSAEDDIRDAADSAMRAAVARLPLDRIVGSAQGDIAAAVAARIQQQLDRTHAGIVVQGVTVRQADVPSQLADAGKDIADAQAAAQSAISDAKRDAADGVANAQGQASAFDKVYQAYRLAPQITRTRMYYDTMEAVLAKTDKVIVDAPNATVNLPPPAAKKPVPAAQPQQQGGGQ